MRNLDLCAYLDGDLCKNTATGWFLNTRSGMIHTRCDVHSMNYANLEKISREEAEIILVMRS